MRQSACLAANPITVYTRDVVHVRRVVDLNICPSGCISFAGYKSLKNYFLTQCLLGVYTNALDSYKRICNNDP